jgi:DNA-binding NtrC family response regulator
VEKEKLFGLLQAYDFILCSTSELETEFPTITLNTDSKLYDQNEILTIDDYVKFIVNSFQYKFPDTELSKKLGISRKSLWEKRKKYDLFKKK